MEKPFETIAEKESLVEVGRISHTKYEWFSKGVEMNKPPFLTWDTKHDLVNLDIVIAELKEAYLKQVEEIFKEIAGLATLRKRGNLSAYRPLSLEIKYEDWQQLKSKYLPAKEVSNE